MVSLHDPKFSETSSNEIVVAVLEERRNDEIARMCVGSSATSLVITWDTYPSQSLLRGCHILSQAKISLKGPSQTKSLYQLSYTYHASERN
jgi:hypothetical protein